MRFSSYQDIAQRQRKNVDHEWQVSRIKTLIVYFSLWCCYFELIHFYFSNFRWRRFNSSPQLWLHKVLLLVYWWLKIRWLKWLPSLLSQQLLPAPHSQQRTSNNTHDNFWSSTVAVHYIKINWNKLRNFMTQKEAMIFFLNGFVVKTQNNFRGVELLFGTHICRNNF